MEVVVVGGVDTRVNQLAMCRIVKLFTHESLFLVCGAHVSADHRESIRLTLFDKPGGCVGVGVWGGRSSLNPPAMTLSQR